jgi:hypothetical protein
MAGSAHNLEPTMETPNESGLNEAIRLWRQELAGARTMHRSDLDELEAHLRDAIGELTQTGLSAEETFLVARRRLGPSSGLSAEFAKVNWQEVWLTRVLWMVGGGAGGTAELGTVMVCRSYAMLLAPLIVWPALLCWLLRRRARSVTRSS